MSAADPVLASVLQRRVEAITKEMASVLMRSSRSPIFNEIGDLITVVFDRGGRTLAQTEYASIIANAAQPPLERILEYFEGELREGDVVLHNDVYSGGNQFADVGVYLPVFYEGELVAWTASKGHVADIGGMTPGGYNPQTRDVWQEAFRIPPLKLYDAGELRRDVWDLICANIRLDIVTEDIKAMVGACRIGQRRLGEVLGRYGTASFDEHMDYVIVSSQRLVRDEIARWPDGAYRGESWMVSDGFDPKRRYRIAVEVRIEGSQITFDFSDSDDQAPGFTNMPPASVTGAVRIVFLMLLASGGAQVPTNHGLFTAIRTVAREGSLLNPRFPAATVFGNQMCDEVMEAIMQALAPILPDRVTAGWNQELCTVLTGVDPASADPFVIFTTFQRGGGGAMGGNDGYDAIGFTGTAGSMRSPDLELFELSSPNFMLECEYLPDSGGPGEWRGGLGTRSRWRVESDNVLGVTIGDDCACEGADPTFGLFGGGPGDLNELRIHYPDGSVREWGSKELVDEIPAGTVIESINGGGGGYGDPLRRDPERVAHEVREGLLSVERARLSYGVVVGPDGRVDESRTREARGAG